MNKNINKLSVSACVVSYNNSKDILPTVRTVLENTKGVNLTLYLSDNGSTDDTVKLVKSNFPQVIIIENKANKGFGHGHNSVINMLSSDYHFVINPDIMLNEDTVTELVEKMEKDKSIIMATPKILNTDGTEQFLPKRNPRLRYLIGGRLEKYAKVFKKYRDIYTMRNENIDAPLDIEFCTGCFFAIRTNTFKQLHGFDERFFMYFEDADITRRARKLGRVVFFPDINVTHQWERASSKTLKYFLIQLSSMFKYMFKWCGQKQK